MVDDLEISGLECVSALVLAGFRARRRGSGGTTLERDGTVVIVPDTLVLPANVLDAILTEAAISHERFLELLAEEPTQPELGCSLASTGE